jgi:hypothetical protein
MPLSSLIVVLLVVLVAVLLLEGVPRLRYHAYGYTPWSSPVVVVLGLLMLWLLGYL